jgi:toxin FitB
MTASDSCLVDSSGWVEYLGDGPKADAFASFLVREEALLVPTIVVYEVCKKLSLTAGKNAVQRFLSHTFRAREIVLDSALAMDAARVSIANRLGMADAIIYATAQAFHAVLVTADIDFQGLPGVIIP